MSNSGVNSQIFNPLDKIHLAESIASALLDCELIKFPLNKFMGVGIYAIYYSGRFELYQPLKKYQNPILIYVGKAIPEGSRKGYDIEESLKSSKLFERIKEHEKNLRSVSNLNIDDFHIRFLIVDDVWIPLGESLMIQKYNPIWNTIVEGFGNHVPGGRRKDGSRPIWDMVHPGREWALRHPPNPKGIEYCAEEIRRLTEKLSLRGDAPLT